MNISKIAMSKEHKVTINRRDDHTHSNDAITTTGVNPLPEFVDSVQAFLPHFLTLVPSLKDQKKNLRVSTISLGDKDGKRSLQVSVSLAVEACGGAVISMTTPRMTEEPEQLDEDADEEEENTVTYLTKPLLKLIDRVVAEATRYTNGETAQGEIFKSSENSKAADERMAAAEVKSTRTPRAQKPATVAGSVPASPVVQ
jgi:hypothetical protein